MPAATQVPLELAADWDPARHPRGPHGRFTHGLSSLTDTDREHGRAVMADFHSMRPASDTEAARYLNRPQAHLTAAQKGAVDRYTGDGFLRINRELRAGNTSDPDVKRLDSAMRPLPDDLVVTRHAGAEAFGLTDRTLPGVQRLAGRKITDKAFASAALGSPHAGGLGGVTMHIAAPKGTPAIFGAALSRNPHERELLLGRNTEMAIARVAANQRGGYDMWAVVLPPARTAKLAGDGDAVELAAQPAAQPPPQPATQQPQGTDPAGDAAAATAATAALTAVIVTALTAAATSAMEGTPGYLYAVLRGPLAKVGITGAATQTAVTMVLSWPPDVLEGTGPAQRQVIRTNLLRRAQFMLNVARRTQAAIVSARSQNQPVMGAIAAVIGTERRYLSQHVAASQGRVRAATAVDGMAATHGNLLGWKTVKDKRTTAECYDADGKNFRAGKPPLIGFPGATHPNCRCIPVKPFKGAPVLPSS